MAYDSATDTALAGQAWKAALLAADNRRTALNSGYGLNSDGSMDNTEAGHLGSIYQGNLASVMGEEDADVADRRRGFGGQGGLGHKLGARAHDAGLSNQAAMLRDATSQLGANTAEHDAANQQYENDKSGIRSRASWDLANTITGNPIDNGSGVAPVTQFAAPTAAAKLASTLTGTKSAAAAIKKNPRIMQNIRNR